MVVVLLCCGYLEPVFMRWLFIKFFAVGRNVFAVVGVPANNKRWKGLPSEMCLVFNGLISGCMVLRVWHFTSPCVVGGDANNGRKVLDFQWVHVGCRVLRAWYFALLCVVVMNA